MIEFRDRLPSRIPKAAKKVFSGEIFDVFQWQHELRDGSKATYEMLKRPDTVDVVALTSDEKIIIIHEEKWGKPAFATIPGGRVKADEGLEVAARRELLEETGFEARTIEPWFAEQPISKIDWNVYVYIARGCHKVAEQTLDAGEKIELQFMTPDRFITLVAADADVPRGLVLMAHQAKLDSQKMITLKQKILGQG